MKSNRRKLGLTKETITKLNSRVLAEVNGGIPTYIHSTMPPCSFFTQVTCWSKCETACFPDCAM